MHRPLRTQHGRNHHDPLEAEMAHLEREERQRLEKQQQLEDEVSVLLSLLLLKPLTAF